MPWTVSSGKFLSQVENWERAYTSSSTISAALKVPIEHKWWYYQEHGWAKGYSIFPIVSKLLAWTDAGGHHALRYVGEWGSKSPTAGEPKRFVATALPGIRRQGWALLQEAIALHNPILLKQVLIEQVMPLAKDLILQNVQESLPGSRQAGAEKGEPAGKLGGRTAAEILSEVIIIEETS